jgi:hypothetical protein
MAIGTSQQLTNAFIGLVEVLPLSKPSQRLRFYYFHSAVGWRIAINSLRPLDSSLQARSKVLAINQRCNRKTRSLILDSD